jgi:hypothetical protein
MQRRHPFATSDADLKPTVLESFVSDDFSAILSYPAAPVLPHQPSAFAVALDSTNIYGQAAMMLRRIQEETNRRILLQSSCDKGIQIRNRQKEELRKKIAVYEEAMDLLKSKKSVRKTADGESKDREAKVAGYELFPFLKKYYI